MRTLNFLLLLILSSSVAQAGIVINGTRVIYPESEKEITLRLNNEGNKSSLVQTWIDKGNSSAKVNQIDVPFVILPPVFRVEPKQGQTLRISYTGQNLPADRESVFYLNVLDIPPNPENVHSNNVQMAFRSRIKLFFRPQAMKSESYSDAVDKLTWSSGSCSTCIEVKNPTPFNITITKIYFTAESKEGSGIQGAMIAPFSSQNFKLGSNVGTNNITFSYLNDYGGTVKAQLKKR